MNSYRFFRFIALIGVLVLCFPSLSLAVENHNSSRSNKSNFIYPGPGSSGGAISEATIKGILDELDKTPPNQVNEKRVSDLLKKNGVTGIKKIIVEPGKGGLWKIILLQDPANEAAARKASEGQKGPNAVNVK